jgi:hypothetical protein
MRQGTPGDTSKDVLTRGGSMANEEQLAILKQGAILGDMTFV